MHGSHLRCASAVVHGSAAAGDTDDDGYRRPCCSLLGTFFGVACYFTCNDLSIWMCTTVVLVMVMHFRLINDDFGYHNLCVQVLILIVI